jgi:hypothetical protein
MVAAGTVSPPAGIGTVIVAPPGERKMRATDGSRRTGPASPAVEPVCSRGLVYSGAVDDLREFIRTARGGVEADVLLRGGRVVNVFTHEIEETAVG